MLFRASTLSERKEFYTLKSELKGLLERIKDKEMLTRDVKAWEKRRNRQRKKIDWTFTKQKADKKLGKYYTE